MEKCTQSIFRLLCLSVLFTRLVAYFYELSVSGSRFVCVLVLLEVYNNI